MRALEINKKTIFYANPLQPDKHHKLDHYTHEDMGQYTHAQLMGEPPAPILDEDGFYTGELNHLYTKPRPYRINVSPAKGRVAVEMFGEIENYDKVMVTCDKDVDIKEGSILWVDDLDTSKPEDYIVVGVAEDINTISYAIRKVKVNG